MTVAAFVLGCVVCFAGGWIAREVAVLRYLSGRRRGGNVDLVGARPRSVRYFDRGGDLPRIEAEAAPDGRVVPLTPFRLARGDDE